jgi:dihydrofolate reductase
MKPTVSIFVAASLDGFIARLDGSIDWLDAANATLPRGEDCGYDAFMAAIDVVVMGRLTFEQVLGFDRWPYDGRRVVVLSRRALKIPSLLGPGVAHSREPPGELLARLAQEGARHVYVDGGITIRRFMSAGLVDHLTITTIPVLLGNGRPLFGPLPSDRRLTLLTSRTYTNGFVQSTYRIEAMAAGTRDA